jgi:hypothetical protein
MSEAMISTGDMVLDQMLEESRTKFSNPVPAIRREALERLWDCWERLKSLEYPTDKKRSIGALLDKAAGDSLFRSMLEEDRDH